MSAAAAAAAGVCRGQQQWATMLALFAMTSLLKLLVLAPGLYRSTDFEVHRNWLAVTHSKPLKDWYWEETSEWTLDYPPLFAYFQWAISQAAVHAEPDLVKITPYYEPTEAAIWFQVVDATLVLGVVSWCKGANNARGAGTGGGQASFAPEGATSCAAYVGLLVLLNSGLFMVDHVHFQYNGFLLGLLLLSIGLIRQGRVLLGGATFACLLMLKHLFLALAPLYFVYLLRGYCCCESAQPRADDAVAHDSGDRVGGSGGGGGYSKGNTSQQTRSSQGGVHNNPQQQASPSVSRVLLEHAAQPQQEREHAAQYQGARTARRMLSWTRLASLGSVVLCVFGSVLGPLCVSDGWAKEACLKQLGQLGARLFPFGRGLVHAYWAPNVWALYLFLDRVFLAVLKTVGLAAASDGTGSTTGGLVRTEVMAVLPSVSPSVCLLLSALACCPALLRAWKNPSPPVFAWGVVHCSLSAFLVGFHVHEKALLVPAVVSALLALDSRAGARMHLRLSFLAAFAVCPILPGPELRVLKVMLLTAHLMLATSLLEYWHNQSMYEELEPLRPLRSGIPSPASQRSSSPTTPAEPSRKEGCAARESLGLVAERHASTQVEPLTAPCLWTIWDKVYVAGAGVVWVLGELVHPWVFGEGTLPFLPLMGVSVFGAVGVVVCWGLSVVGTPTAV